MSPATQVAPGLQALEAQRYVELVVPGDVGVNGERLLDDPEVEREDA